MNIPLAALLWSALALAGDPPLDAGLPTQVDGGVTFQASDGGAAAPVVPFMKLRVGDALSLAEGSRVDLVFFTSGRREQWSGPSAFVVEKESARAVTGAATRVLEAGAAIGEQLRVLPVLIARTGSERSGQHVVRGGGSVPPGLDAFEQAEVDAARARFAALRATVAPDDVLPELLLVSTLAFYGLDAEVAEVIAGARARCAACDLPTGLVAAVPPAPEAP